jgi:hypothetical protein
MAPSKQIPCRNEAAPIFYLLIASWRAIRTKLRNKIQTPNHPRKSGKVGTLLGDEGANWPCKNSLPKAGSTGMLLNFPVTPDRLGWLGLTTGSPCTRVGLQVKAGKRLCRKISKVVGHDDIGTGTNGGSQHMAVVRVGQGKGRNQIFVARHEAVTDGLVHQGSGSCQALGGQAWIVLEDIANPFIMDRLRPPGTHKSRLREPDEQIPEESRVKDVRVVDSGDGLLHQ